MLSKLTKVQVMIIGVVVTLIVSVGMFFLLIKPASEKLAEAQAKLEARKQVAARLNTAKADLVKATQENVQAKIDYARYEEQKMPEISFEDRAQGMIAYWRERAEVLGPMLKNWPRLSGVELMNDIKVDAASSDPNSYQDGLMTYDMKEMTVQGSYSAILRHIASWNRFPRLVQVSPFTIEGVSPNLTAKYSLKVFMFPRGKMGANVAMAVAGTAGGAGAPPPGPSPSPGPPAGGPPAGGTSEPAPER